MALLIMFFFPFLSASNDKGKEEEQIPAGETSPEIVNNLLMTPKPVRARICGEKGNSSVVKYKITTTPGYVRVSIFKGPVKKRKKGQEGILQVNIYIFVMLEEGLALTLTSAVQKLFLVGLGG